MRPARPTTKAQGISHARMFMRRDLSWMRGFPSAELVWTKLPRAAAPEITRVDRRVIHRTTRTVHTLLRDFPRALPKIVGDTARWFQTNLALLDAIKPAVQGGRPLPSNPIELHPFARDATRRHVKQATATCGNLAPLVNALTWMHWTDIDNLDVALEWVEQRADQLRVIRTHQPENYLMSMLRLWKFTSEHGAHSVDAIVSMLAEPAIWTSPMEGGARYARTGGADIPKVEFPNQLIEWIGQVGTSDIKSQGRCLRLFPLLTDYTWASRWQAWWRDAVAIEEWTESVQDRMISRAPPARQGPELLSLLSELAAPEHVGVFEVIARVLPEIPASFGDKARRLELAITWLACGSCSVTHRHALRRALPELVRYLTNHGFHRSSVDALFSRGAHDGIFSITNRDRLDSFLTLLHRYGPLDEDDVELLTDIAEAVPLNRIEPIFRSLRGTFVAQRWCNPPLVRWVERITHDHPSRFRTLLLILHGKDSPYDNISRTAQPIVTALHEAGRIEMLHELIEHEGMPALIGLLSSARTILKHDGHLPAIPDVHEDAPPAWGSHYPAPLQESLSLLEQADSNARQTALHLLDQDLPDDDALRRQLAHLRSLRDPTTPQRARITMLEGRLNETVTISAGRMQTLKARIRAAAHRSMMRTWGARIETRFREVLQAQLGVDALPEWYGREDVRHAFEHLEDIPVPAQSLARRVLRHRCQPPPWDFRTDPQNARFLSRMAAANINMQPWIDGAMRLPATLSANQKHRSTLAIERDPLELLSMGRHFNTCLSPGGCNYFSVFSNIVDINKQVIYARADDGSVQGRMLIALTDGGGIVTFCPYAHNEEDTFAKAAESFVHGLAYAMGSIVLASGEPANLVADDWYDDGCSDHSREREALSDGSPLRRMLKTVRPSRLVSTLERGLSPLPLNGLTLPLVLGLPEVVDRPELVAPLVPLLQDSFVPFEILVSAIKVLAKGGFRAEALQLCRPLHRILAEQCRRSSYGFLPINTTTLLARHDPIRALDLLRIRKRRLKVDYGDIGDIFVIEAKANERLNRPRRALAAYRSALKEGLYETRRESCETACARLERWLARR